MMSANGRSIRVPFTASQWQELEHQALIFKYMVSGMPIPSHLLYTTIKTSLDSSLSSNLILHQPQHIGWNCFQMGFGRKIDPDPGRCRRTDGKKWRCSKEAYADSKYCERHMHRGRNRSRKPVEVIKTTPTKTTTTSSTEASTRLASTAMSISLNNAEESSAFGYLHSSSSGLSGHGFSSRDSTNFFRESSPYSLAGKGYRNNYGDGMKEVGEHTFLSEASVTMRNMSGSSIEDSWRLTIGTAPSGHSDLQLHSLDDDTQQRQYQQYYYAQNSDDQPKKVMHHFFDEWPPKDKDSWLDSEDKLSINDLSLSKTQLSISMPNSSRGFFIAKNEK